MIDRNKWKGQIDALIIGCVIVGALLILLAAIMR
jgi:hypothetical protein